MDKILHIFYTLYSLCYIKLITVNVIYVPV